MGLRRMRTSANRPDGLRLSQFAGATKITAQLTDIYAQQSYYGQSGQDNTASATIQFSTDGNIYYTWGMGALQTYRWLAGGNASDFDVEGFNQQIAGNGQTSGTMNRQNLGGSPRWSCSAATRFGFVDSSMSFGCRIYQAGTGNVIATANFSIYAAASDGSIG